MAILGFEVEEVEKLVALVDEQGLDELIIEENGRILRIRGAKHWTHTTLVTPVSPVQTAPTATYNTALPMIAPPPRPAKASPTSGNPAALKADQVALESPMVGVFYRSPKPGDPPFIEIGQTVSVGQIIGMIEAMKTFSNVEAEHAGTVVSIPAKDGDLVQMGKPLAVLAKD